MPPPLRQCANNNVQIPVKLFRHLAAAAMRAGFPFAPRRYIMDAWKSIANGKADGIPAGGAAPRRAARRTSPTGRTARRRAIARAPSSVSARRAALRRRWWCCSCWWRCTRSLAAGRTARPPRRRPYRRLPRTAALPARRAARGRTARSTSIFSTWARPTARSSRRRTGRPCSSTRATAATSRSSTIFSNRRMWSGSPWSWPRTCTPTTSAAWRR